MSASRNLMRLAVIGIGLLLVWQAFVSATGVQHFILPSPLGVFGAFLERGDILMNHAAHTAAEIVLGFALGSLLGVTTGLMIAYFRSARDWLLPVLIVSQAVPVFILAPILVLWLGYGIISKIVMTILIIYFPVTVAFYDGLRRTDPGWLDLAQVMGGSRRAVLRYIRIPAAIPALGSGLRIAASVAPIGAVVGEWVGSSAGLGYYMLHQIARQEVEVAFAALFILAVIAVTLYFTVDSALRRAVRWQSETLITD